MRFALLIATAGVFTALLAVDLWNLRGHLWPGRAAQTGILVRDNPQAEGNVVADVSGVDARASDALAVDAPAVDVLAADELTTDESVTEASVTEASVAEAFGPGASGLGAAVTEASVTAAAVTGAPATDVPVTRAPVTKAPAADASTKSADGVRAPPAAASTPAGTAKSAALPKPALPPRPARDSRTDVAAGHPPDAASVPNRLAPVRFVIPQPGSRQEFSPSGELSQRLVQAARRGERIVIRGRLGQETAPADEQDAAARAERARRFLIVRGVPAERIWIGASVRTGDGDRALIIDVSTRGDVSDEAVLATAPTRGLASPGLPARGPRE